MTKWPSHQWEKTLLFKYDQSNKLFKEKLATVIEWYSRLV